MNELNNPNPYIYNPTYPSKGLPPNPFKKTGN